jgi:hypothetical protein
MTGKEQILRFGRVFMFSLQTDAAILLSKRASYILCQESSRQYQPEKKEAIPSTTTSSDKELEPTYGRSGYSGQIYISIRGCDIVKKWYWTILLNCLNIMKFAA